MPVPATINKNMFASIQKLEAPPVAGGLEKTENTNVGTPYVGFLSMKNKKVADIIQAIPGIQESSPFFHDPVEGYKQVNGLRYILLDAYQFWAVRDGDNNVVKATETPQQRGGEYTETVETLALVFMGDQLIPVVITFKSGTTPGYHTAKEAVSRASTPEWADKSPDHRIAFDGVPYPKYRVVTSVTTFMAPTQKGHKMIKARGNARPISLGEAGLLAKALENPKFQKDLEACRQTLTYRVKTVKAVVAKGGK